MKKSIIAVALLSSLAAVGTANAAFTEASDGTFTGSLEFNGTITNDNPNWMWEIPAATQTAVTDIAKKHADIVVNGSNGEVVLTESRLPVLEGYMKTTAATGGAGLTPVIMIGGTDVFTDACTGANTCPVTIDATHESTKVGQVLLDLKAQGAFARSTSETEHMIVSQIDGDMDSDRAFELIRLTSGLNSSIVGSGPIPSAAMMDEELSDPSLNDIAASRVVFMESSKLAFPKDAAPAMWSATLPVSVTLK